MTPFVSRRFHLQEMQRAKLREELLKSAIAAALSHLRRAALATPEGTKDAMSIARGTLSKALCEVTCI